MTPPHTGWKIPWDGAVRTSLVVGSNTVQQGVAGHVSEQAHPAADAAASRTQEPMILRKLGELIISKARALIDGREDLAPTFTELMLDLILQGYGCEQVINHLDDYPICDKRAFGYGMFGALDGLISMYNHPSSSPGDAPAHIEGQSAKTVRQSDGSDLAEAPGNQVDKSPETGSIHQFLGPVKKKQRIPGPVGPTANEGDAIYRSFRHCVPGWPQQADQNGHMIDITVKDNTWWLTFRSPRDPHAPLHQIDFERVLGSLAASIPFQWATPKSHSHSMVQVDLGHKHGNLQQFTTRFGDPCGNLRINVSAKHMKPVRDTLLYSTWFSDAS